MFFHSTDSKEHSIEQKVWWEAELQKELIYSINTNSIN